MQLGMQLPLGSISRNLMRFNGTLHHTDMGMVFCPIHHVTLEARLYYRDHYYYYYCYAKGPTPAEFLYKIPNPTIFGKDSKPRFQNPSYSSRVVNQCNNTNLKMIVVSITSIKR